VVLALAYQPWAAGPDRRPLLDATIAIAAAAPLVQLVPLPSFLLDALSPHARAVWRQMSLDVPAWLPLSVDLDAGTWAAVMSIGVATVFLTARRIFAAGGVRTVVRGVALIGLVLAAIGLAQDVTAHGRMYWRWAPLQEGAPPFGPFVDRNHFATWVVLAAPLCLGYLAAHTAAHRHDPPPQASWRRRVALAFDGRAIWLTASVAAMIVALVVSLSRSGMLGLSVALLVGAWLHNRNATWRRPSGGWIVGGLAAALALVLLRIDPAVLGGRLASAHTSAAGRLVIWRDTLPVVRDFWLTGTGAGTYETAMLVYQRSSPGVRFNQAHNQYLQLAAEGGLLLALPVIVALSVYIHEAWHALTRDLSGMYWVRAGAACGLAGVAAQSIWETGLTTPANALLAAVAAAVLVHTPGRSAVQ